MQGSFTAHACSRALRPTTNLGVGLPQWTVGVAQTLGPSEGFMTIQGMAMNFLACDREQPFLMPPDPRDWLPEDHLAWFLLGSVEQMDLSAFYGSYRTDGWGRAAFEPKWSRFCSTPTRGANAHRGGSSASAWRMSPTG